MRMSEEEADPKLSGFIQLVFGYESKLTKAEFIQKLMTKDCKWIFSGKEIRLRMEPFFQEGILERLEQDYGE